MQCCSVADCEVTSFPRRQMTFFNSCVESDKTQTELKCGGELWKPLFPKFNCVVQLDGHNKPQNDMWHVNFERT